MSNQPERTMAEKNKGILRKRDFFMGMLIGFLLSLACAIAVLFSKSSLDALDISKTYAAAFGWTAVALFLVYPVAVLSRRRSHCYLYGLLTSIGVMVILMYWPFISRCPVRLTQRAFFTLARLH
jgi:hypothetical protein